MTSVGNREIWREASATVSAAYRAVPAHYRLAAALFFPVALLACTGRLAFEWITCSEVLPQAAAGLRSAVRYEKFAHLAPQRIEQKA